MECCNPYFAYDTGKLTDKGNKKYFIDFGRSVTKKPFSYLCGCDSKKIDFVHLPPYSHCENGIWYLDKFVKIPCGKCPACQLRKASDLSTRLYFESFMWSSWYFVTLTYNDSFYSEDRDFKRDFQLFMKRLRKEIESPVRFFASFEKGEHTRRGHFHMILFFDDIDDNLVFLKKNHDNDYFSSCLISKCWPYGFNVTCPSSDNLACFNYVSRYCCKKVGDNDSFQLFSRRPGLGVEGFENVYRSGQDSVLIHSNGKTFRKNIPKFLREKLKLFDPDSFDQINDKIKNFIYASYYSPLTDIDLIDDPEYRKERKIEQVLLSQENKFKKKL